MAGENPSPRKSPKHKSNSHPLRRGPDPHEFHHPHNKIRKDKDRPGQLPSKTSVLDSIKSPKLPQSSSFRPNFNNNNNNTVIRKPTGDDEIKPSAKDKSKTPMESSSQVKKQEVTKKKGGSSNAKEREKKVYSLPGQKHDPPEERDPLRIFYESLYEQIPTSEMATIWMMEHGLLPLEVAKKAFERKQKKQQQQRTGTPIKSSSVTEKKYLSVSEKKSSFNGNSKEKEKSMKKSLSYGDDDDNFIARPPKKKEQGLPPLNLLVDTVA